MAITIFFISEAMNNGSPPSYIAGELAFRLVENAIPDGLDYVIDVAHQTGPAIEGREADIVHVMQDAGLVIADLTELSDTAYFLLGAREHKGLPTVYLCAGDHIMRFLDFQKPYVAYSPSDFAQTAPELREAIIEALQGNRDVGSPRPQSPAERRNELVKRIEATASALRALRINSISESVQELETIADELKKSDKPSELRKTADKALKILHSLMDQLGTEKGAQLIVAGAIAFIVGGTGAAGATAYGAGLAFWFGKDAFTKWLEGWKNNG
jgi:hypothetical protein